MHGIQYRNTKKKIAGRMAVGWGAKSGANFEMKFSTMCSPLHRNSYEPTWHLSKICRCPGLHCATYILNIIAPYNSNQLHLYVLVWIENNGAMIQIHHSNPENFLVKSPLLIPRGNIIHAIWIELAIVRAHPEDRN